jgi:hypothetical protein
MTLDIQNVAKIVRNVATERGVQGSMWNDKIKNNGRSIKFPALDQAGFNIAAARLQDLGFVVNMVVTPKIARHFLFPVGGDIRLHVTLPETE